MTRYDDLIKSALGKKPKSSKYHNNKTDGYASRREAKRAQELKMLEQAGEISNLQEQVYFTVVPEQVGEMAVGYVADFVYYDMSGNKIVEDCKGMKTREYILKRKLMLYVHGIKIKET